MNPEARQPLHTLSIFGVLLGVVVMLVTLQFEGHSIVKGQIGPILFLAGGLGLVVGGAFLLRAVHRQRKRDVHDQVAPFPKTIRYSIGALVVGLGALILLLAFLVYVGGMIDGEVEESQVVRQFFEMAGTGLVVVATGFILMFVRRRKQSA